MFSNPAKSAAWIVSRWGCVLAIGVLVPLFQPRGAGASSAAPLREVLGTLTSQDVVRLHSIHEEPTIGRFVNGSGDSIRVKPTAFPVVSIALSDVTQLDRSEQRSTATWTGVLLGTLAGAAATAWITSNDEGEGPIIFLGFAIVPVGAGIGALMGSGVVDYHWETRWKRPEEG